MNGDTHSPGPSRRDFLKGLGATGAGLVAAGARRAPAEAAATGRQPGRYPRARPPASTADFGRIFPQLPPFAEANDTRPGGAARGG